MDTTLYMVWVLLPGSSVHVPIPRSDVSSDELTTLGKIDIKFFKCREEKISAATFLKLDACLHDNNGSLLRYLYEYYMAYMTIKTMLVRFYAALGITRQQTISQQVWHYMYISYRYESD